MPPLVELFTPDAVFPHLKDATKKQALKRLAEYGEQLTGLNASQIYSVLMDREQAGVTAMGEGVGIPHGRFDGLDKIHALAATLDHPIEFGAADGRLVDILFVLLTPMAANTEHLKAMATLSRLLRDPKVRQSLRAAKTPEDMVGVLHYHQGGEAA